MVATAAANPVPLTEEFGPIVVPSGPATHAGEGTAVELRSITITTGAPFGEEEEKASRPAAASSFLESTADSTGPVTQPSVEGATRPQKVIPLEVYAISEGDRLRLIALSEWDRELELSNRYDEAVQAVWRAQLGGGGRGDLTPLEQAIWDHMVSPASSSSQLPVAPEQVGEQEPIRGRGRGRVASCRSRRGRSSRSGSSVSSASSSSPSPPSGRLGRWDDEEEATAEVRRLRYRRAAHTRAIRNYFSARSRRGRGSGEGTGEQDEVSVELSPLGAGRPSFYSPSSGLRRAGTDLPSPLMDSMQQLSVSSSGELLLSPTDSSGSPTASWPDAKGVSASVVRGGDRETGRRVGCCSTF